MAMHSDTDLYRAIAEFQKFVARRAPHLPRDVKRLYGERLVDESLNMLVTMRHANIAREAAKIPLLEELLDRLEICQAILRTLRELGHLPNTAFSEGLPLVASIGKQAVALRNHFAPDPSPAA